MTYCYNTSTYNTKQGCSKERMCHLKKQDTKVGWTDRKTTEKISLYINLLKQAAKNQQHKTFLSGLCVQLNIHRKRASQPSSTKRLKGEDMKVIRMLC